ncbi:MAG: BON domain-containing protein, partial [Burkholderiaceae bacterium]|nr:BON domain-containing protein [Burkholderiaceae bacterium]
IVSEHGTVYLLGLVTQREGNLAGQIASGVTGVHKVVKVFDYISEDELKRILATSSTDASKESNNK